MKEFEKTVRFHRKMHGEFFEKEELLYIVKIKSLFRSYRTEGKRLFRAVGGI